MAACPLMTQSGHRGLRLLWHPNNACFYEIKRTFRFGARMSANKAATEAGGIYHGVQLTDRNPRRSGLIIAQEAHLVAQV